MDSKVESRIKVGDLLFAQGNLEEAPKKYINVLAIKPFEGYPKRKILEIDRLLSERKSHR